MPEEWDTLRELGADSVPVVAKGDRFTYGQSLADVAAFVGIAYDDTPQLPPDELVRRLDLVLAAAQRLIRQIPADKLDDNVLERERTSRELAYHTFRIADAFIEVTIEARGEVTLEDLTSPAPNTIHSIDDIVVYGEGVRRLVQAWWTQEEDRECARLVPTYWGEHRLHLVLERMTWHPAQHVRQFAMLLDKFGIKPDRPLTAADLDGLPVPEKVWDE